MFRFAVLCVTLGIIASKPVALATTPTAEPAPAHTPVPTLPPVPVPTPPVAPVPPSAQHFIIIQSNEGLQIGQKERREWYQEGLWPIIGSVATIILTNTVAIFLIYFQSRRSFNALLRQRKIELLSFSLNDFYNPLLALIDINGEIFAKTGPTTFPEEHHEREAAALVWEDMKKKILENNREIELILKTKTHFISKSDSLDAYKALLVHVAMYETFQKIETDRYARFLFPREVKCHIAAKRASVLSELHSLSGERI